MVSWKRSIVWVVAALAAVFLLFVLLLPLTVPTIQDAQVSDVIRESFINAVQISDLTNRTMTVVSSPRHNSIILFISGNLSDSDKKTLQELAYKVGKTNNNRLVGIVFK